MSPMIEKVASAIQEALDKPKYCVKIGYCFNPPISWELWDTEKRIFSCNNHNHVDMLCDKMNSQYAAIKAIEALKPLPEELQKVVNNVADWADGVSPWEAGIDAILGE